MRALFLSMLLITFIAGFAQDASVYKRLHGVPVDTVLKVYFSGKTFEYVKDNGSENLKSNLNDNIFNISNDRKNILFIHLYFYNPLKYKVDFSVKEIEDPDIVVIKTFIDSFQSHSLPVNTVPSVSTLASVNKPAKKGAAAPLSPSDLAKADDFIPSRMMYDWIDNFINSIDPSKVASDLDKFNEIVQVINDIESAEKFLYYKVSVDGVENSVVKWAQEQTSSLKKQDKFSDFAAALTQSDKVALRLGESKQRALQAINEISELLTDKFNDLAFFLKSSEVKRFKLFSAGKRSYLEDDAIDAIEKKGEIVEKLKTLNKKSHDFLSKFNDRGYLECYKHEFNWDYDKMREYTFSGATLDDDGSSNDKIDATFVVGKDKGLALFASSGVFYTPYAFNNFGIQNGQVVETNATKIYARPAIYLNMMFKRKRGDLLYWLAQIGISEANDAPLIPVGGGIVLRNNFSLTGGGLIAWQNQLDGIQLNDPVDDAKLKNSIKKQIDLGWYISLNYKLGK